MKRLLIVAGVVVALCGRAGAWWEVKDNPDRFISFGVKTGNTHFSGSTNNLLDPNLSTERLQPQSLSGNVSGYGFDMRLPVMKWVTFNMSYDKFHIDTELVREANTFQNHNSLNGERVEMGFRLYLAN